MCSSGGSKRCRRHSGARSLTGRSNFKEQLLEQEKRFKFREKDEQTKPRLSLHEEMFQRTLGGGQAEARPPPGGHEVAAHGQREESEDHDGCALSTMEGRRAAVAPALTAAGGAGQTVAGVDQQDGDPAPPGKHP